MCSVIGVFLRNVTSKNIETVREILLQSRIRGMHATGVTYYKNNQLNTVKEPVSSKDFLSKHSIEDFLDYNDLTMIAHCRYSTSDLEYNQPIYNDSMSVVHNGVISQELPENWKKLYGYNTATKNDTELLAHSVIDGDSPLVKWKDASISVVEIYPNKSLRFYRNGKRPLHYAKLDNGYVITSTADIMNRANSELEPIRVYPGIYNIIRDNVLHKNNIQHYEEIETEINIRDLQP